jgi:hypothetical protein
VILADGPEAERPRFAERQADLLQELGLETAASRAARFERASEFGDRIFALAEEIIARHPDMID